MPVFLYTDIEGSTQLWEKHGSVMSAVLDRHDEILVDCIEGCRGRFVKHSGDGILAVFEGSDALPLDCALAMQRRLAAEPWPGIDELRVRVALHAGAAQYRAGDYFGSVINRVARLLATAWGGQIVVTPAVLARATVPEDASLTDLGVHLLKDLSEPQQVFGLLHPDLPLREFPALRSMSSRPNNLPQQPTPLVGRKEELAEIAELLARPECRLLTLVAPGGMGKTRLGLQAAAEQIDCFRHGVFFVPLAGVTSADNLPATIANALKFAFYDSADLETQLHSYLSEKQILLLLDNFEHLMAGVETVAGILSAAPQVKILATSRQRLHLQGEWTYDVSGLPVPQHGRGLEAEAYAAVELFLQAAQRLKPSFDPGRDELQAIVRVCRLVDGMPLALELAAAWIDTLSCQEIAAEIEQDLDLLTTEMRDVPARQRSVRAVFEHAWHRLGPEEQAAFARLSVFRGGFTRTAARKVSGAGIRTVATLIDEALMARDSSGRFQMHELLRQFAAEKLAEDKEAERSTRADHAAYFADWLQTLEAPLLRGQRSEPIKQIDQELDNVLLAGRWALDRADADLLEAGLNSLFWFYEAKAWYADGLEAYSAAERAVAHRLATEQRRAAEDETLTTRLARLHLQLRIRKAWFATRLSRYDDDYLELPAESDTLLAEGDYASHWVAYGLAINTLYGRGRYAAARRLLEHYDEIAEAH
ncbi:MAG: adenylate/guanylate cyclase domain-containing protein, partial [Candidatus Promineifilaceae bacterium]|nr:adenylate/guanylate cyclase domain-containing protein [Candidatus Promineifilaceae bacterium]